MRIKRTVVFVVCMAILFSLILLAGRFPSIIKMDWNYMIQGDPAWRWVVNIIVAAIVAIIINACFEKFRVQKLFAIIAFLLTIILMESFAWHAQETIEIIKSTTIFVGIKGVIWTAVAAFISFIINVGLYDGEYEEEEDGG